MAIMTILDVPGVYFEQKSNPCSYVSSTINFYASFFGCFCAGTKLQMLLPMNQQNMMMIGEIPPTLFYSNFLKLHSSMLFL